MQLASVEMALAMRGNPYGDAHASGLLGSVVQPDLAKLSMLVIGLPIAFLILSIPTWLASKFIIARYVTFGQALKVQLQFFLAWLVLAIIGTVSESRVSPGSLGSGMLGLLMCLALIAAGISITARVYQIGGWHAFGLNLLSGFIALAFGLIVFFGCAAVVGLRGAKAPLEASVQKIANARLSENPLVFTPPSFLSISPPQSEGSAAEIDQLLDSALHPRGAPVSLAEREMTVRQLQGMLQIQRNNLVLSDPHAVAVYQNRLNRYLLLLDTVKAERKAQAKRNATAARSTPAF